MLIDILNYRMPRAPKPLGVRWPLRPGCPKAAKLMDQAEADVLAHLQFPAAHRVKIYSPNPLERLNKEVKRRTNGVGIFPNEARTRRLIVEPLREQNEEWQLQHRYRSQHPMVVDTMTKPDGVAALPAGVTPSAKPEFTLRIYTP